MSQRGLEALLRPKSIAVIGASMKPQRAGYLMMRNLLAGGFNGPVMPVTPRLEGGSWGYWHGLPSRACRLRRIWRCSVLTPGVISNCLRSLRAKRLQDLASSSLRSRNSTRRCSNAPRAIRCVCSAPNSLGLLAPWQGLNASFSPGADPSR